MKVAVLSKKTANNIVTATIDLRFGDATTLAGQREAASFAGALLMAGTKNHTRAQIAGRVAKTERAGFRIRSAEEAAVGSEGGAAAAAEPAEAVSRARPQASRRRRRTFQRR